MNGDAGKYGDQPRDEKNYDYWECRVNLGELGWSAGRDLMKLDKRMAKECLKKAPVKSRDWVLDYILVTGSPVLPGEESLGRIFVFKSPKVG